MRRKAEPSPEDQRRALYNYLVRIHGDLITAADEVFRQNGLTFDEAWRSIQTAIDATSDALHYLNL